MACNDCPPLNPCYPDPCVQPDPCQNPIQLDATAIFYNLCSSNINKLYCTGLPNGTSVAAVLEAFDAKLCQYINYDFSRYNLSCLRQKYTITSLQQFAEASSREICIAEAQIATLDQKFTQQILTLSNVVNGILYPQLVDGCGLGILITDSIKVVLQKILAILCTPGNLPDNGPNLIAQNTNTISFVTSGIKGHTISAGVNISPTLGNVLQALGNGLYVPTPPAQIPQVLSIDYTSRTISLSNGGGYITLPPDLDNQILTLNISAKTIAISGGNTIDLTPLFQAIAVTQTPNNPVNTNSINITASGTANTTFSANLNLDGTQANAAVVNTHGLYVAPEQTLVANDSSTIDFVTSGIDGHTLTAAVKTDLTQPNALVINANGLFVDPNTGSTPITGVNSPSVSLSVSGPNSHTLQANAIIDPNPLNQLSVNSNGLYVNPASGNVYTANNGLTQTIANTQLGGSLLHDTSIDFGSTYQLNFTSKPRICIGNVVFLNGSYFSIYNTDTTINIPSSIQSTVPLSNDPYFSQNTTLILNSDGLAQTGSTYLFSSAGQLWFQILGNVTLASPVSNGYAGLYGAILKSGDGNISGNVISGGYFGLYPADDGDIAQAAGVRIGGANNNTLGAAYGGTIVDYDGLRIEDISSSFYGSSITNPFAIRQLGTNDTSIFFGPVQNASAVTQFTSDKRVKENIVPFEKGLEEIEKINVKTFNFKYSKERTVTGVIAQEVEEILPEAIQKGHFETPEGEIFEDFRMVDQNVIIYSLLNAVKTLSAKVKILEEKLNLS